MIDADGQLHASLCVFGEAPAQGHSLDLPLLLRVAASLARERSALMDTAAAGQSAAGEEDPGSALDAGASDTRGIQAPSMCVRQAFTAGSPASSSLHDS